MDKPESVAEFLIRGGQITRLDNGSATTTTSSEFVKRDKQLKQLKKLRKMVEGNEVQERKVEAAMHVRYEAIKWI